MTTQSAAPQSFEAVVAQGRDQRVYIETPFDPDEAWGVKATHHVNGTIDGHKVRGPLTKSDGAWRLILGPAWRRDCGIEAGAKVSVVLTAEGPQQDSLPDDLVTALESEPAARAFWDALPTFYRKAYLSWIGGASRRPALREERLRELIALLKAERKQRER